MSDISAGTTPSKGYAKYLFIPVLIVVVGYVLLYLTYKDVKQEIVEDLNARQMIHARQAARGIEAFFDDQIDILQNLARNEHLALLDETGKRMMREFQLSHSEEVSIITRIDSQGRILYPEPFDPTVIGQPVTKMEDFEEAKRTHKVVVSDVFANRRGFKSMIVHVPVLEQGYFEGTLAVLLPFDFIAKRYVEDIRIGKGGYAWVISRNGTEVSCPVPGHVGNSVFDNCREFPDILAMAERMTRGEEGVTTYTFDRVRENIITKTTKHAVFMPIHLGNNFWSIVVATPEDEVTRQPTRFPKQAPADCHAFDSRHGALLLFDVQNPARGPGNGAKKKEGGSASRQPGAIEPGLEVFEGWHLGQRYSCG